MPAGYSKTPLVKKLGIKPGFKVYFANPPDNLQTLLGDKQWIFLMRLRE